jgi:organic hydroperoxide reductase OsmC/OhrA
VLISAHLSHAATDHRVSLTTGGTAKTLAVPARADGPGSAVNGGEFLMLALATCYCNDLYREAKRLGIRLDAVEVEASAEFDGIGLAATNIRYRARVSTDADDQILARLLRETDAVAEVHNTIRSGAAVALQPWPSSVDGSSA